MARSPAIESCRTISVNMPEAAISRPRSIVWETRGDDLFVWRRDRPGAAEVERSGDERDG